MSFSGSPTSCFTTMASYEQMGTVATASFTIAKVIVGSTFGAAVPRIIAFSNCFLIIDERSGKDTNNHFRAVFMHL